jgi:hypothetical protein
MHTNSNNQIVHKHFIDLILIHIIAYCCLHVYFASMLQCFALSSRQVSKFEDIEFVEEPNGSISAEWTISCPQSLKGLKNSGGVNIKVCVCLPLCVCEGAAKRIGQL